MVNVVIHYLIMPSVNLVNLLY